MTDEDVLKAADDHEYQQFAHWFGPIAALKKREADRLRGEMLGLRAKLRRTEALLEESSQREAELREMYARTWRWRPGALRRWLLERVVG